MHRILFAASLALLAIAADGRELYEKSWSFDRDTQGWIQFKSWPGAISVERPPGVPRTGKGALRLAVSTNKGVRGARMLCMLTPKEPVAGCRFRWTGYVAGRGTLKAEIAYTFEKAGKKSYRNLPAAQWQLTKDFQQATFEIPCDLPGVISAKPAFRLSVDGELTMDDVKLVEIAVPSRLQPQTKFAVAPQNGKLPLPVFTAGKPETPVKLFDIGADDIACEEQKSGADGKVMFTERSTAHTGDRLFRAASAEGGMAEMRAVVLAPAEFNKLAAIADRIQWQKPKHILYLGDSLTDFRHDHNYTDRVNWFLNRRSRATFRNAAVHGDYITRVLDRLNGIQGKKKAFKQFRYDKLWDEKYDLIFLWLGHNDTVSNTTWSADLPRSRIEPAEQQKTYTPLSRQPDKNTLFDPVDGIHPTDKGHDFLTGLFLEYLADQVK